MAPYVYYYKGDKWFVYKVIENAVLGLGMLGFAIWFWSMILQQGMVCNITHYYIDRFFYL